MAKISENIQLFLDKIAANNRYVFVCLSMLCLAVYANSLSVPFYFDDYSYIVKNPFIRTIGGIFDKDLITQTTLYEDVKSSVLTRPLSYFTFALNYAVHQTSVVGYHLVNILIHLINSCLVYTLILLTCTLYSAEEKSSENRALIQKIAFFSAAIFAVHPVMTNAVTYVVQRMASLATLFYLLTVVLYARSHLSGGKAARLTWYLLSLASCVAAMKSKEIAYTLPLMLIVYDSMFCRSAIFGRFKRLLPFLLCALVVVMLRGGIDTGQAVSKNNEQPSTAEVISFAKISPLKYLNTQFATNPNSTSIVSMSPLEYFYTQFRVVVTYQRMLLLPVSLNFVHDYPFYRYFSEPAVLLSLGLHLLILSSGFYMFRLSGTSGGDYAFALRLTVFGICWFYLTLVMECGLIPMDDHILEHRMYLPAFGFIVAVISLLQTVARRFATVILPLNILLLVTIILFSVLTILRNEQWRDPLLFWQDALSKSPGKKRIHGYIGNVYRGRDDMPSALKEYRLMLANDFRYGQDHFGLGEELLKNGLYREAVEEYLVALKIKPDKTFVYERLAEAYRLLGDERRAGEAREKAANGTVKMADGQGVW